MDIRPNVIDFITQDGFLMKPPEERKQPDLLARRMKNRERQRRYRARKRLEANTKKACSPNQPTPLQPELQLNGLLSNCMTRVYCKRNWKKDARTNQVISKQPEITSTVTIDGQKQSLPSDENRGTVDDSVDVGPCETGLKRGRRDWKAEARSKKN